ncbi:MAG: CAP domain-containing protein [Bacillota bacterium]
MQKHRRTTLLVVAVLAFMMIAGQAAAAGFTRYVVPLRDGSTAYVFAKTGEVGMDLPLRDVYGAGLYPWELIWRYYRPTTPKPAPKPAPTPQPAPQPAPTPEPKPETPPATGLTAKEQQMINLVNQERAKAGLKPLAVDMTLVKLARMKSQDMIDKNYFAHQSPTYGSPFDMMKSAGVTYRTAGENLAGASTVERAHTNLMNSSGHRANILNANFTHIGIGIIEGGPYGMMLTQMFIGK